jgi:dTMP kinase
VVPEAAGDIPTEPGRPMPREVAPLEQASTLRLFGTRSFFRLWLAQVVSSLGDWMGLVAVTAIAQRIGGGSPDAAIGIVLSARLVPGFFLAPAAGVFLDRWDRKKVMVICDIGRGLTLASLPFVDTLPGLVLASFLLEIFTLMWSPAKEASVPNLVRPEFLANANSLSLVAAYGTFPVGTAMFAALSGVAKWLGHYSALHSLRVSQETVAIWFDVGTFFVSAIMISTLALPKRTNGHAPEPGEKMHFDFGRTFRDLKDGWKFIGSSPVVRAVIIGIGTGLVGGGMMVPLGAVMSREVLAGGTAGFGLLLTALGTGVATGVIGLSVVQRHLPHERIFVLSVMGAGVCQIAGASMGSLLPAMVFVAILGLCAGGVYILGFTILQTNVDDEYRGRIFATLYTLIRFCLLLAFGLAPFFSGAFDRLSESLFDKHVQWGGLDISLPGVRLTLWLGGLIILGAGFLARVSLRSRDHA